MKNWGVVLVGLLGSGTVWAQARPGWASDSVCWQQVYASHPHVDGQQKYDYDNCVRATNPQVSPYPTTKPRPGWAPDLACWQQVSARHPHVDPEQRQEYDTCVAASHPHPAQITTRYGWANNETCWEEALAYRRSAANGGDTDPVVHEHVMRGLYDDCADRQTASGVVTAPSWASNKLCWDRLLESRTSLLSAGREDILRNQSVKMLTYRACLPMNAIVEKLSAGDAAAATALVVDPEQGLLEVKTYIEGVRKCIQASDVKTRRIRELVQRYPNLTATEQIEAKQELERADASRQRGSLTCGFINPTLSGLLVDLQTLADQRDNQDAEQANDKARRDKDFQDRRWKAQVRASTDPRLKAAQYAENACEDAADIEQAIVAEAHMQRVDEASGTVNYTERRRITEARMASEARLQIHERAFVQSGGRAPAKGAGGRSFWCNQPKSAVVGGQLVQAFMRETEPTLSSQPQAKDPTSISCGSPEWSAFRDAVTTYCSRFSASHNPQDWTSVENACGGLNKSFSSCSVEFSDESTGDKTKLVATSIPRKAAAGPKFFYRQVFDPPGDQWRVSFQRDGKVWKVTSVKVEQSSNEPE